jgi:hypothetical protein
MFPNRDRDREKRDRITVVRDVVEIVAIVAAGIWAFYIFAYENSFKPAHAPPAINMTVNAQKLSEHNGLIAVRIRTQLRNSSTVAVRLAAFSLTAYGRRVTLAPAKQPPRTNANEVELRAFYRWSKPVPVYSTAHLGKIVDSSATYDSQLGPGNDWDEDDMTYVPVGAFDLLTIKVNVLYVRDGTTGVKVRLTSTPQDGPDFVFDKNDLRINQFTVDPIDSLDLNQRL